MPLRPDFVPVRVGDRIDLDVEAHADGPDTLARLDGYVVLVSGALPGERIRARMTSAARKFGRAETLDVEQPSADRVEPHCRHFLDCGGCHWQHLRYDAQLRAKEARLRKDLAHTLGEAAPPVAAAIAAPSPYGERHKVALQLLDDRDEGLLPALHRAREIELVPIRQCPASSPEALELAFATVAALADLRLPVFRPGFGDGLLRSVLVRRAAATGQSHVIVVSARADVPGLPRAIHRLLAAGATTVSVNVNDAPAGKLLGHETIVLEGPRRIREQIDGVTYCISPDAFFQTSPASAAALVAEVRRWLQPGPADTVLDLYCGGGLFALQLARHAGEVVGLEESATAVGDAIAGAKQNHLRNARFERGQVEGLLRKCSAGALPKPTLAVLDPPRAGASPVVLQQLAALRPRRIAYVGCDPASLARDLLVLQQHGYRTSSVQPVDMFPQTAHVEAVACLERST